MSNSPRGPVEVPIENDPAFRSIVTQDSRMKAALVRARKYALANVAVLIVGESGTGKELFARAVHDSSKRAPQPFLALNMACMTEEMADSELFGHSKGAFTGATANQVGLFEAAGAGTIFLDEIGEADLHVQKKLLRVLDEREVRAVGDRQWRKFDAAILCATNRDLEKEVAEGSFRKDLYYRLAGHVVSVPPLRERPGDIERLARHFLREYLSHPPPE